MSFSAVITEKIAVGDSVVNKTNTLSSGGKVSLDESIANAVTNGAIVFTLDVSQVKAFYLVSDQALTVKTNSSGSPDNTITLVAGIPYVWYTSKYDSFKLTVDVTVLYVTNASGSAARMQLEAIYDPTP